MTGSATTAIAATQAKTPGVWKRNQRARPGSSSFPGIAVLRVYVIIPIFQSVWISFHEWDGLGDQ
jgi:multiple sugar transport system permease protein